MPLLLFVRCFDWGAGPRLRSFGLPSLLASAGDCSFAWISGEGMAPSSIEGVRFSLLRSRVDSLVDASGDRRESTTGIDDVTKDARAPKASAAAILLLDSTNLEELRSVWSTREGIVGMNAHRNVPMIACLQILCFTSHMRYEQL